MNEVFLEKLIGIIESNIGDSSFGARELSKEMGISYSSLFRKVRSLTGKSINQYIREIRLESALEALKEGDISVSEAAFKFGFSSPSYFTACFKKQFGYLPGGIRKNNGNGLNDDDPNLTNSGKKLRKPIILIAAVLLAAIMLTVYFLSFKGSELRIMTEKVTVTDDIGNKFKHRVFKSEYIKKIAAFQFKNLTPGDSTNHWISYGMPVGLNQELDQFPYIYIGGLYSDNYSNYQAQLNEARALGKDYFITGSYRNFDGNLEITSRLYETKNGFLLKERGFTGPDILQLMDTISYQVRLDLGISRSIIESYADIPFTDQITNNIEAYKYYSKGKTYTDRSTEYWKNLKRSFIIDSTFAQALYEYTHQAYFYQRPGVDVEKYVKQAMRYKDRLRPTNEFRVRALYYDILDQDEKAIALTEMHYYENPPNIWTLRELARLCEIHQNYEKLEKTRLKMVELDDTPPFMSMLARAYLLTGKVQEGLKLMNKLIQDNPEYATALFHAGEFSLQAGDFEEARKYYKKAILLYPAAEKGWSRIFDAIKYAEENSQASKDLEKYTGIFRLESNAMEIDISESRKLLIIKTTNQGPIVLYFSSDSTAMNIRKDIYVTWDKDDKGVVSKIKIDQGGNTYIGWKQDSLIQNARGLFEEGNGKQAIEAFQEAFRNNPAHYYLANYIKHLEFIHSPVYKASDAGTGAICGTYNDSALTIGIEKGKLKYKINYEGLEWDILPLSEDLYMVPQVYNSLITLEKQGKQITEIYVIGPDGPLKNPGQQHSLYQPIIRIGEEW